MIIIPTTWDKSLNMGWGRREPNVLSLCAPLYVLRNQVAESLSAIDYAQTSDGLEM